jgi:K+-sensing histidine kinase KdpD
METYHASPDRSATEDILQSNNFIQNQPNITGLLDALPNFVMILDQNRQVVYINKSLHTFLKVTDGSYLGKRPGELINCRYSSEMKWGCGTSKNCRFCGAVNSILESQNSDKTVTKDCRIISSKGDVWTNYEFSVSSTDLKIEDKHFTLFNLIDISDKKRRLALERVFFHDLINSAGSLNGILDLLTQNELDNKYKNLLSIATSVSHELVDEIISQRQILDAENNELKVNFQPCNSLKILNQITSRMSHHAISKDKVITLDKGSVDVDFICDPKILARILINMAKNALEAVMASEEVILKVERNGNKIIFSSTNPGYIPEDIQLQIFHRTFSTKGENRGLGTYSMKMHTEKYLNGKIYFNTSLEKGTTFYCELPFISM